MSNNILKDIGLYRSSKPEKGNKFYNTIGNGGWSTAIVGKPKDAYCDVLSNCFSGDTKIVTREGVVRLDSIVGKEVMVLSKGGVYRPAVGTYHGEQEMYEVLLNNGQRVTCTGNHRWLVQKKSTYGEKSYVKEYFKTTTELNQSDYIPYVKNFDVDMDPDGIRHGFIYGDGTYYNGHKFSQAYLCRHKISYMMRFFEKSIHIKDHSEKDGIVQCYPYPAEYKSVPDLSKSLSYLRGFICGLIASDGCVDRYGCTTISTVKKDDCLKISEILSVLAYKHTVLIETRDTNYKTDSTLYRLSIRKTFIPKELFLNPVQYDRISVFARKITCTRIRSVTKLGYTEDAFCVSEPETHTITLDGMILTGQCVGAAFGYFNEIAFKILGEAGVKKLFKENGGKLKNLNSNNRMPLLQPLNAENFYDVAIQQGLEVSQTPEIGAIICWQKGATRKSTDGAGHVATVIDVLSPTCVITAESGYNCNTSWWTQTRQKGTDGNWGQSSAYKFLGFIKNPAITGESDPYPVPTRVLKEGDHGEDVKWMQWKLKKLTYLPDEIDGWFGVHTLGALLVFQLKNGLDVDGVCGPATRKMLQSV